MNRDPLFQKIIEALAKPMDGHAFETCAVALLGQVYPNLAPLPGGDDAGMDGAFGTPDGPFPLVCTVQDDVLGNFRKNIKAYRAKCTGPARAVIATSQSLTNRRKRNLHQEAIKLGVTLVNIHDQPYFANQLYREPKWRSLLLGIVGDLPALSALPRRGRFSQPRLLIGRADDLAWLKETAGDLLVIGKPGSGKTYLHQYLADQKLCLFAVDNSPHRLVEAIREQEPSVVVVDDAHFDLALVQDLARIRIEIDVQFDLHLNCWPGHEAAVRRIMTIADNRVRRLEPLVRKEVLTLIKGLGIEGPAWLQHLLISQADGKPGLAVALAELCKVTDIERIWSGEAAADQLLADSRLMRDEKEKCVLAGFAIGGDGGMSLAAVARGLGVPQPDLRQIIAGLSSGGLIDEVGTDCLQVRPPAIRAVLVRDVFYCGPSAIDPGPLLSAIRCRAHTATVMLCARQRGAVIDDRLLEELVTTACDREVWEHFAWIDEGCAAIVLDKYPEQTCAAAPGLLKYFPSRTLHALLDADESAKSDRAGAIDHPRRRISEWVFPFEEGDEPTIERRQLLLSVLEERVKTGKEGGGETFTWALTEILCASFDVVRPSPGSNREIQNIRGGASHAVLAKIVELWPRLKELVRYVPTSASRTFFDQLEFWCIPQRLAIIARPFSKETASLVQEHGQRMLTDMLAMPNCNRAWRTRAARIAAWGRLAMKVDTDPTFDAVYADRDHLQDWQTQEQARLAELLEIADRLADQPMVSTLDYLDALQSEAVQFGHKVGNSRLSEIYRYLADRCGSPADWLEAMIARNCPAALLMPFVYRLGLTATDEHEAVLSRLLSISGYQLIAISRVIRLPTPTEELLAAALATLRDPELVENLWLHDPAIPDETMLRLLAHPDRRVRGAAAIGEWHREPKGSIRTGLQDAWRTAARDIDANHYALKDVFGGDPSLAFEWLRHQIDVAERPCFQPSEGLDAACKVLNKEQRRDLLRRFNGRSYSDEWFDLILGQDIDVFADWLENQPDKLLRLRPLDRDVSPRWERMALMALDSGASPQDVANHCTPRHWVGFGPLSEVYLKKIDAYEKLARHSDQRLRFAGQRGLAWSRSNAEHEGRRERWEEVYGE